jgi:hypothetical protein
VQGEKRKMSQRQTEQLGTVLFLGTIFAKMATKTKTFTPKPLPSSTPSSNPFYPNYLKENYSKI